LSDVTNSRLILSALVKNEAYLRKILPHIKPEYFEDETEKRVFQKIFEYAGKYKEPPDKSTLIVDTQQDNSVTEQQSDRMLECIESIYLLSPSKNNEWLEKTTEEFCQNRAVYNAIQTSIDIYKGEEPSLTVAAIPGLLSKAISISFDHKIGLDFFADTESRFEFYSNPASKIPFRLKEFNEVTCGGITRKTLNVLLAGTNAGKSLALCSLAADYIRDGLNVLYVTLEMREELIAQRIDANILGIPVNDIAKIGKEKFMNKIDGLREKTFGQLVIKEYAPGSATAATIRNCIDDLRLKKNFIPDIIIVDYVTIVSSYRIKAGSTNSYFYYKAVAEELRALGIDFDAVVWTAGQFNRGGLDATDVGLGDIAESAAIAHVADGIWGMIRTEELDQAGQILFKQLKSRYANRAVKSKFCLGVNIDTQTLYDLDARHGGQDFVGADPHVKTDQKNLKDKFLAFKG
jgi:replicative DNA helicase